MYAGIERKKISGLAERGKSAGEKYAFREKGVFSFVVREVSRKPVGHGL